MWHGLMTWLTSIHPSLHATCHIHPSKEKEGKKKKKNKTETHRTPPPLLLLLVSPSLPPLSFLSLSSLPTPAAAAYAARFRRVPASLANAQHRSEPLPPLFPSLRPDPLLAAPRAHPRPLPMARVLRVASPPTPACRWRLCSALSDAHRKSHGQLPLVVGSPAPGGCGADARGG